MLLYGLLVVFMISSGHCAKFSSLDTVFTKGVEAYSAERWSECIVQFEEALHLYKLHKSIHTNCRLTCNSQQYKPVVTVAIEDLKMYEKFINVGKCLSDCQRKGFDELNLNGDINKSVLHKMQAMAPYEYLHICYFQMNAIPKAANAAYTFVVANPESETMKKNLEYYLDQQEVDKNEVVDLESEEYKVLYRLGLKTYNEENWGETVAAMEEVLTDYLNSENNCRVECENQPEGEWSPEFVINTANNMIALIQCRQKCQEKLKYVHFNSGPEFLADILNYLQISYYHLQRINDAAKAVATHLAIMPDDEDMLDNKKFYSTSVGDDAFSERSDIVYYIKRDNYEKALLAHFYNGQGNGNDINTNST